MGLFGVGKARVETVSAGDSIAADETVGGGWVLDFGIAVGGASLDIVDIAVGEWGCVGSISGISAAPVVAAVAAHIPPEIEVHLSNSYAAVYIPPPSPRSPPPPPQKHPIPQTPPPSPPPSPSTSPPCPPLSTSTPPTAEQ